VFIISTKLFSFASRA